MGGEIYGPGVVSIDTTLCPPGCNGATVGDEDYILDIPRFSRSSECRLAAGFCRVSAEEWATLEVRGGLVEAAEQPGRACCGQSGFIDALDKCETAGHSRSSHV